MDYEIGFAGIPADYHSEIQKEGGNIVGKNASFWSKPLPCGQYVYSKKYNDQFCRRFAKLLRDDFHHSMKETAFIAVYVVCGERDTAEFVEALFPSFLAIPVQWSPVWGGEQLKNAAVNELILLLARAVSIAKSAVVQMRKEVVERANRTPFLLPLSNFDSNHLAPTIMRLQDALGAGEKPDAAIREHSNAFEQQHSPTLDYTRKPPRYFFEDRRKVMFRAPGKDLHGQLRPYVDGHPDRCVLTGLRRLGAPFHHSFHYDCTRASQQVLAGDFFGCHEPSSWKKGNPHLNIAPNDNVR